METHNLEGMHLLLEQGIWGQTECPPTDDEKAWIRDLYWGPQEAPMQGPHQMGRRGLRGIRRENLM